MIAPSMSPAQQLAKYAARFGWDERPYLCEGDASRMSVALCIFGAHHSLAPRESRIPAPEKEPWLNRRDYKWVREAKPFLAGHHQYAPRPWSELRAAGVTREPREFNPLLVMARDLLADGYSLPGVLELVHPGIRNYSPVQVSETRVILERLQSVIEATR